MPPPYCHNRPPSFVRLRIAALPLLPEPSLRSRHIRSMSSTFFCPFDFVKGQHVLTPSETRLQVRHEDKYRGLIPRLLAVVESQSTSLFSFVSFLIWLIFKERSIKGFFDGASLRLSCKIFPSAIVGRCTN